MIVATYNSSDNHGGAAKAAFRLNAALRSAGVEAFFFCRHKQTRDPFCVRLTERRSELPQGLKRLETFWTDTARHFLISQNRTGLSSTIFRRPLEEYVCTRLASEMLLPVPVPAAAAAA